MAILTTIQCPRCKLEKQIYLSLSKSRPELCGDCTQKQKIDEKAFHLYKLSKLTVEQRLVAIEEQLYDWVEYNNESCIKL